MHAICKTDPSLTRDAGSTLLYGRHRHAAEGSCHQPRLAGSTRVCMILCRLSLSQPPQWPTGPSIVTQYQKENYDCWVQWCAGSLPIRDASCTPALCNLCSVFPGAAPCLAWPQPPASFQPEQQQNPNLLRAVVSLDSNEHEPLQIISEVTCSCKHRICNLPDGLPMVHIRCWA